MVYFKDKFSSSGEYHLIILDDQHQPVEKGTILAVYTRLVSGRNVSPWPRLTNSFYLDEWSQEVSRCGEKLRLINAYDAIYASLFTYDHNSDIIKAFCEVWCPLTNTLLTSTGELSISLWDLHDLVGLPMMGCLYDEVVPSALELTGADEKGGADDDRCSNVSIDKWVKFWSKTVIKHLLPPPRKEKKMVRPKSTHNLLGDITTHKRWSTAEEALFEKLWIEGNLKEEVYLAAYLACWLCTFVLLGKDVNSIRPSTFKMASMMASGRRVSLAIPVLASIYEDLNTIATSSRPTHTSPSFPVHFVYAWLASYFKTHYPVWQGLYGPKMTRFLVKEVQSIMTHKKHASGSISPKPTKITIKCKKHEDEQVDSGENNPPHVLVLSIMVKSNSQAVVVDASKEKGPSHNLVDSDSSNKDRHWKRQKKELTPLKATEASASRSPSADFFVQLEEKVQSIDASEESETSHSWTTTPPLGMGLKGKQLPRPPAVSVFEGESFLFNRQKEFLQKLWSNILMKISDTLVDFLSSIEDDVHLVLESMKSFHNFDIMKEAKARFQDVQAKASEEASKVQSIVDELEHIEKEIMALRGQRTSLYAALKEQKQLNHDAQANVHEVEEDIATLDNTAPFDDAIVEGSKANLEILKEDLKSLKPFA
ncbi:UNVERIFIED_CONTAM: hypothetical protein Slati_2923000 [Sesamum latifolium]|uniref:Aminotransferase-like plant mobile domain-containing protein n=1 Tax=Sesamum latifolium TaxID=2727402 RepID=A0AAW2VDI8_9LAMI